MPSTPVSPSDHDTPEKPTAPDASLYVALADLLGAEIASGNIPDEVGINESMISQLFNVSRTPARQALLTLAERQLITALPKRGFVTGQEPTPPTSRLTDHPDSVENLIGSLKTATNPSPLYEELEKQLTRLSVHGAWRISIRAVQEYYDVSRSALDDALRDLEINGLVAKRPGGQWIAQRMDCTRLEALFDVRSWLEPKLMELATVQIPVDVLNRAIQRHETVLENLPNATSADLDALESILHHELMSYADNAPGLAALRSVKAGLVLSKHLLASDVIPVGTVDPFIDEHLSVLGALKRRRSEECRLRLLAHLLKSREKCASRLEMFKDAAKDVKCDFAKRIEE